MNRIFCVRTFIMLEQHIVAAIAYHCTRPNNSVPVIHMHVVFVLFVHVDKTKVLHRVFRQPNHRGVASVQSHVPVQTMSPQAAKARGHRQETMPKVPTAHRSAHNAVHGLNCILGHFSIVGKPSRITYCCPRLSRHTDSVPWASLAESEWALWNARACSGSRTGSLCNFATLYIKHEDLIGVLPEFRTRASYCRCLGIAGPWNDRLVCSRVRLPTQGYYCDCFHLSRKRVVRAHCWADESWGSPQDFIGADNIPLLQSSNYVGRLVHRKHNLNAQLTIPISRLKWWLFAEDHTTLPFLGE